jgi:hypothetical protein
MKKQNLFSFSNKNVSRKVMNYYLAAIALIPLFITDRTLDRDPDLLLCLFLLFRSLGPRQSSSKIIEK